MWVVVGLGNPGRRYARSRHNAGFRVVDRLAARWGVEVGREAHRAFLGEARRDGERVLLVKPQTYYNASGEAVGSVARFYRFDAGHVIAVHDDADLALGRVRIKAGGGGAGGNHGVESLIAILGPDLPRVKLGIGRPPPGWDTADHVLAPPSPEETEPLAEGEERAADAVELVLAIGPERAMNRINQKETAHGGPSL